MSSDIKFTFNANNLNMFGNVASNVLLDGTTQIMGTTKIKNVSIEIVGGYVPELDNIVFRGVYSDYGQNLQVINSTNKTVITNKGLATSEEFTNVLRMYGFAVYTGLRGLKLKTGVREIKVSVTDEFDNVFAAIKKIYVKDITTFEIKSVDNNTITATYVRSSYLDDSVPIPSGNFKYQIGTTVGLANFSNDVCIIKYNFNNVPGTYAIKLTYSGDDNFTSKFIQYNHIIQSVENFDIKVVYQDLLQKYKSLYEECPDPQSIIDSLTYLNIEAIDSDEYSQSYSYWYGQLAYNLPTFENIVNNKQSSLVTKQQIDSNEEYQMYLSRFESYKEIKNKQLFIRFLESRELISNKISDLTTNISEQNITTFNSIFNVEFSNVEDVRSCILQRNNLLGAKFLEFFKNSITFFNESSNTTMSIPSTLEFIQEKKEQISTLYDLYLSSEDPKGKIFVKGEELAKKIFVATESIMQQTGEFFKASDLKIKNILSDYGFPNGELNQNSEIEKTTEEKKQEVLSVIYGKLFEGIIDEQVEAEIAKITGIFESLFLNMQELCNYIDSLLIANIDSLSPCGKVVAYEAKLAYLNTQYHNNGGQQSSPGNQDILNEMDSINYLLTTSKTQCEQSQYDNNGIANEAFIQEMKSRVNSLWAYYLNTSPNSLPGIIYTLNIELQNLVQPWIKTRPNDVQFLHELFEQKNLYVRNFWRSKGILTENQELEVGDNVRNKIYESWTADLTLKSVIQSTIDDLIDALDEWKDTLEEFKEYCEKTLINEIDNNITDPTDPNTLRYDLWITEKPANYNREVAREILSGNAQFSFNLIDSVDSVLDMIDNLFAKDDMGMLKETAITTPIKIMVGQKYTDVQYVRHEFINRFGEYAVANTTYEKVFFKITGYETVTTQLGFYNLVLTVSKEEDQNVAHNLALNLVSILRFFEFISNDEEKNKLYDKIKAASIDGGQVKIINLQPNEALWAVKKYLEINLIQYNPTLEIQPDYSYEQSNNNSNENNNTTTTTCSCCVNGTCGQQGAQGETGPQGIQGEKGEKGERGEQGLQGPEGPQGIQGVQGPQGPQGEKGEKGDTGEPGPQGEPGQIQDIENSEYIKQLKASIDALQIKLNDLEAKLNSQLGFVEKIFGWIKEIILGIFGKNNPQ
jgi:hypothetical protein